jgi:O-methyltransferase
MIEKLLNPLFKQLGYKIVKDDYQEKYAEFLDIYEACKPYTMTSTDRMFSLYKAVEYIIKNGIEGDFVECGVWKGGSSMLIAKTLLKFGVSNRHIWMYDTYEGMSEPTDKDKDPAGTSAEELLKKSSKQDAASIWCYSGIDEVKGHLQSTGYPIELIHFVKGKVEDSIPVVMPENPIALLRLDTDWYESTKHEMDHLYPHLVQKGILIIDDYGHWQGARKAIDEYLSEHKIAMLLNTIDYTGRIAVKA